MIIENKDENTIEIYDAKYYDIKFDGKTIYKNPGIGDAIKQFCYQLSYEKTYKVIKNIFVFSSDTENNQNEGFIEFEIFEGKKNTFFIFLRPKSI
ncbi:LlaJI family restriction endonuclease [Campylobacter sp. 2018MI10]|nr:LlaJI family restriction endonuclease [Campylobacter sp. 2018MI27]MBT0884832.1 LlaJI family restriction endonuclease [Campylobacter sp. 2018MI10]